MVLVTGDTTVEPDERVALVITGVTGAMFDYAQSTLFGVIANDDGLPTLTIKGSSLGEGNAASQDLPFTASLSFPVGIPVTFTITTANDGAIAPSDYVAEPGRTITIAEGSPGTTFALTINGDTAIEPDERILVMVSNVNNARYEPLDSRPYGTIRDDDGPPALVDLRQRRSRRRQWHVADGC